MKTRINLSDALKDAFIEKDDPQFCTVYVRGKEANSLGGGSKVIGIDHVGKSDFEIIEEAVNIFNEIEVY
jgi:hypothetical protein